MRKQASGKGSIAFYTIEAVGYGFKREVEPQAEFLRRNEVIEMKVADGAVVVLMLMIEGTEVLRFFFKLMMGMLMGKGVKRLVRDGDLHQRHHGQVKQGKLSFQAFHHSKGRESFINCNKVALNSVRYEFQNKESCQIYVIRNGDHQVVKHQV